MVNKVKPARSKARPSRRLPKVMQTAAAPARATQAVATCKNLTVAANLPTKLLASLAGGLLA